MKSILLFAVLYLGFWVITFTDIFDVTHVGPAMKRFFEGSVFGAVCFYLCLLATVWQSVLCLWRCFRPRRR